MKDKRHAERDHCDGLREMREVVFKVGTTTVGMRSLGTSTLRSILSLSGWP